MKQLIKYFLAIISIILTSLNANVQENWERNYTTTDGSLIKVYQPQPESFVGNTLKFRTPFSIQQTNNAEPLFGTFWAIAMVQTNRDSRNTINSNS